MDSVEIFIVLVFITLIMGIAIYFFRRNTGLRFAHRQQIEALAFQLEKNQYQIANRQYQLSRYHFLRYNLSEALVVQPEIDISV